VSGEESWLEATGLAKHYGGTTALVSADLTLRRGEIRGLVGPNGAGKSTLVKILAGEVAPDGGELRIGDEPVRFRGPAGARAAGIVDVPQELTVAPNMSVADNLMLGHFPTRRGLLDERAKRAAVEGALGRLGLEVPMDAPVATLQPIEQRLVMVARALARDARLVLFDEPTATASPSEVALVLAAIRLLTTNGVTILYVSHRLDEVVELCDAVTVMRDGRSVAELPVDAGTRERLVEMMSTAAPEAASPARRAVRAGRHETVLDVEGLWGGYLRGVSLSVAAGEIVGVAGLAGSGAANLPLVICGAMPAEGGSVSIAGAPVRGRDVTGAVAAGLGFIAGDRGLGALRQHSVAQNVSLTTLPRHRRWGTINRSRELGAVREAAGAVALTAAPSVTMATLSGGNQQKAIIARWIAADARVLLLNDPTAGVDVASRREIHDRLEHLAADGVGMLLVSTDLEELAAMADRVLVLERGRIRHQIAGAELTEQRLLDVMTSGTAIGNGEGSA
jgi:ribose transport system ATP-binding protein